MWESIFPGGFNETLNERSVSGTKESRAMRHVLESDPAALRH